jgi:hypothetical protein
LAPVCVTWGQELVLPADVAERLAEEVERLVFAARNTSSCASVNAPGSLETRALDPAGRLDQRPFRRSPGKLSTVATLKTGLMHGSTIELDSAVPEMEGKRVRVIVEALDEPRIAAAQQQELWQAWALHGPQGPIDDGPDTELP